MNKKIVFSVTLVMALALSLVLAGCDSDVKDDSYSLTITGNASAKTLTFVLAAGNAQWKDDINPTEMSYAWCRSSGTGNIDNATDVNWTHTLSADKKTATLTASKEDDKTGTVTITPGDGDNFGALNFTEYWTITDSKDVIVKGSAVTFTID